MPALSARAQGYLYALAAPLCWSVGGVVMRTVEAAPWDIVFWRAAAHLVFYPFVLVFLLRVPVFRSVRDFGWLAFVSALMLGASFVLHVIGMTSTTVANALLLQATSPLMVALFARFFLGESVSFASWIAIAIAFAGLVLVMGASVDDGAILGKSAAIAVAVVSTVNVIIIRRMRGTLDLRPAMVPAALLACLVALVPGNPLATHPYDIAALVALGLVQMTLGLTFFYAALKRLSAVEVTLIALIEPVIGSLWTWLAVGEVPSDGTLVGGSILLGALAFNTIVTARRAQPA